MVYRVPSNPTVVIPAPTTAPAVASAMVQHRKAGLLFDLVRHAMHGVGADDDEVGPARLQPLSAASTITTVARGQSPRRCSSSISAKSTE